MIPGQGGFIGSTTLCRSASDRTGCVGLGLSKRQVLLVSLCQHTAGAAGRAWYPTAGRLPDGRVLVTGAFTDYATDFCIGNGNFFSPDGNHCLNPQVCMWTAGAEWG